MKFSLPLSSVFSVFAIFASCAVAQAAQYDSASEMVIHLSRPVSGGTQGAGLEECGGTIRAEAIYSNSDTTSAPDEVRLVLSNIAHCSNFDILQGEKTVAGFENYKIPTTSGRATGVRGGSFVLPKNLYTQGLNDIVVLIRSNSGKHADIVNVVFELVPTRVDYRASQSLKRPNRTSVGVVTRRAKDSFRITYDGELAQPGATIVAYVKMNSNPEGFRPVTLTQYEEGSFSALVDRDTEGLTDLFFYAYNGGKLNNWDFEIYFQDVAHNKYDSNWDFSSNRALNYKATLKAPF